MIYLNLYKLFEIFREIIFPLARILPIISLTPIFGENFVNKRVKILISVLLSIFYINVSATNFYINLFSNEGFLILFQQIFIGLFLGFVIYMVFSIPVIVGEIISLQIGLSFSTIFDVSQKWNSSVFSYFIKIFFLMVFLSLNGHYWIIYTIFNSFSLIPIENLHFSKNAFFLILYFFSKVFLRGVIIVFPIMIPVLALNIMMAILNRTIPQFSVFSIFLPMLLLISLFIFYFCVPININNFNLFLKNMFEKINNFNKNTIFY
ncbi:flagellar biosynthetic protein FliR [Buchnera aphidicola (Chaitoregma tattakana)]|uniref:flagellar biosynthetic protein FliR n=1 Tax=Buchnera aphidicola TaxID=9 RepID=UPI0031B89434